MKTNTIKFRIFKYSLLVIVLLIALVAIIFNFVIHFYIKNQILGQLTMIESRTEDTALQNGPHFYHTSDGINPPPPPDENPDNDIYKYYFMLEQSLREPLSVLNAHYILLDNDKNRITPGKEEYFRVPDEIMNKIKSQIDSSESSTKKYYFNFYISGTEYISIITPVSNKNSFGLGYIAIYSSLQNINQLQLVINLILFFILILSALITVVISSFISKKISAPFSLLNDHIRAISERNFESKINMPVYNELQDFVNNINIMSEKLEKYDEAQKTFLQNASHEFRTPLMSIQSYAEGIKYDVVDSNTAADVIIGETKRMTSLVENLLYLSRLEAIEENYHISTLSLNEIINDCIERISAIAIKNNIKIISDLPSQTIIVNGDEEKLCRAITNIISNCIKYAETTVIIDTKIIDNKIQIIISDDGCGIDKEDLPKIFDRFYKGKNGNFGLGLAISKNVIKKHGGSITASNSGNGALFIINLPK